LEWEKEKPVEIIKKIKNPKILVERRMGGFGDIIFLSVIAREIKEKFPGAVVDYAIPSMFFEVLLHDPYIDNLLDANSPRGKYDVVLDMTDLEYRVELGEQGRFGFIKTPRTKIYLDTIGIEGNIFPKFYLTKAEIERGKEFWKGRKEFRIVIGEHGSNMAKTWPKMLELVSELRKKMDTEVIVLDKDFAGTFREVGAVLLGADLVISPDTGVSNLAAALGVTTITIFSNRNGEVFSRMFKDMVSVQGVCPYQGGKNYCDFFMPCLGELPHRKKENIKVLDCMESLGVATVLEKVDEVLC
jgi:ADP-heptose:LPS heptosyltransferase